ncbi:transglycosylase domain-containing protein [Gordonia zhaorongruii]|uniref:transglycosylase domain-containing protein n=1 Tax=Gordonia zhaorongruii TaxID=2597659 RepID=UPI00104F0407|nr:transglycosylase domain-containing protein [Gordonia zhaorongruii]
MTSRAGESESRPRKTARITAWVAGLAAAAVPALAILGVIAFVFTYITVPVPGPGDIKQNQVATITDARGGVLARVVPPQGNRTDVKYDDIPESMVAAVKAAEDRGFDSNSGFSLSGFTRAVLGKVTNKVDAGGGSTITQQYVKNAIVGDEVSYKRKFKELAISTKMSRQWDKDDIMAAYLNTIYFGRGAYGVAAASKAYFNKDLKRLTPSESALLASVIRGPSLYDPALDPEQANMRWNYVLDGMVSIGYLSRQDRESMKFPKVSDTKAIPAEKNDGPNGLIRRQVLSELETLGISEQDVRTGGLKVTTSIDPKAQKALVSNARDKLSGEPDKLRTASVSIDPETGGVEGYYGGEDGQGWDYASAGLQTGSVFKVFALVAGLEQDIPLSKTYSSAPYQHGKVTIENSEGESCGTCNLATALKMSLNTVYYRLMMDLKGGAQAVADAAHQLGIAESFGNIKHTLQGKNGRPEGGVVLGQYPSRVLDMASAYATLAASGIYRKPFMVKKVETSTGEVLFDRQPDKGKRVVPKAVADNVTAAMQPIAAYSNGNSLYDPSVGPRVSAAKTGTAQLGDSGNNKDAWMVGYTPQLSTAVWVGTDEGTALRDYGGSPIYGSGLPAQIWKAQMDDALAGEPVEQFPEAEAVGGQAGVPYEAPAPTYTETEGSESGSGNGSGSDSGGDSGGEQTPTRDRRRGPGSGGGNGEITIAPGVTIPFDEGSGQGDGGDDSGDGGASPETGEGGPNANLSPNGASGESDQPQLNSDTPQR